MKTLVEDDTFQPCHSHKFNFKNIAKTLSRYTTTTTDKQCSCESSPATRKKVPSASTRTRPFVHPDTEGVVVSYYDKPGDGGGGACSKGRPVSSVLWASEIENVVGMYRWMIQNRSHNYPKGCNAVLVYQMQKSKTLPPGVYVYKNRLSHFGCTAERPLAVVDQFNFVTRGSERPQGLGTLPKMITLEMFPGNDNFSAIYVIGRKLSVPGPEYSNRLFGEAIALDIIDPNTGRCATACGHHGVAMRTEKACVLDLRWRSFDTKSTCFAAVPRVRGMQAVVWSNHSHDVQEIECQVLMWLFGTKNELPRAVQLIDYKHEKLGVRYILMDTSTYPGNFPTPPSKTKSFFTHIHFAGDVKLATQAIGEVPVDWSRMGSPTAKPKAAESWFCLPDVGVTQPTPFTGGRKHETSASTATAQRIVRELVEWLLERDGTSCLGIAVQHTLYYVAREMRFKIMISHIVMDNDSTLNIFRL